MFVILIVRLIRFFRYIKIVFCIDRWSSTTSKSCRIQHLNSLGFCWCETRLLLAAPMYSWENVEHQRHSTWSLFSFWQNWPLGKELPIHQPLTSMISRQDSRIQEKRLSNLANRVRFNSFSYFLNPVLST